MEKRDYKYKIVEHPNCPCFTKAKESNPKGQLMDLVHPEGDICKINKTAFCKQPDYFEQWRPQYGKYLDYDLTETDTKMVKEGVKVHVINTKASYGELNPFPPPPTPPPPPPKKVKYFHGRGPCWEYLEEKFYKKEMAKQEVYKQELKIFHKQRKRMEYLERKSRHPDHDIIIKKKKKSSKHDISDRKTKLDTGIDKAKERWEKFKKTSPTDDLNLIKMPEVSCNVLRKMKLNGYFHGKIPCWIFLEEIWQQKYDKDQEFYKERLEKIKRNRKKEDRIRRKLKRMEELGIL